MVKFYTTQELRLRRYETDDTFYSYQWKSSLFPVKLALYLTIFLKWGKSCQWDNIFFLVLPERKRNSFSRWARGTNGWQNYELFIELQRSRSMIIVRRKQEMKNSSNTECKKKMDTQLQREKVPAFSRLIFSARLLLRQKVFAKIKESYMNRNIAQPIPA